MKTAKLIHAIAVLLAGLGFVWVWWSLKTAEVVLQ